MKNFKLLLKLIIAVLVLSCNNENLIPTSLPTLSLKDMSATLSTSSDFKQLVIRTAETLIEMNSSINSLTKDQRKSLKTIFSKYKSVEEFDSKGSAEEIKVYKDVTQMSKTADSNVEIAKLLISNIDNLKRRFNFDKGDFAKVLTAEVNKISGIKLSEEAIQISGKEALVDCTFCIAYQVEVYTRVLNQLYYEMHRTIEQADQGATVASFWAYAGCVIGCLHQQ